MRCSSSQSLIVISHGNLMYSIQDLKSLNFADEFLHPLYTARRRIAASTTFPQYLSNSAFHFSTAVCVQTIKHFPGVSHVILKNFLKVNFLSCCYCTVKQGFLLYFCHWNNPCSFIQMTLNIFFSLAASTNLYHSSVV